MDYNLVRLPVELLRMIIEELRWDEDVEAHDDDEAKVNPYESIKINHDLIHWSCKCSYFRNLLAPDIFRTVKLFNDGEGNSSLNTVARSQHNIHVKELHLIGFNLGDSEKVEFSDTEETIPRCVENLVRLLQRFPNLEKLSLKFEYGFGRFDEWIGYTSNHVNAETPEQALEFEDSAAWRTLMSKTYSTLVQYKSPHFKHFEIRRLIWEDLLTFNHATKLSHFEQFTLSLYGKHSLAGWKAVRLGNSPREWETWTYVC